MTSEYELELARAEVDRLRVVIDRLVDWYAGGLGYAAPVWDEARALSAEWHPGEESHG